MGEMAEDLIDGASCSLCGCYFEEDHGYPVLCKHCWKENGGNKSGYQRAINQEI